LLFREGTVRRNVVLTLEDDLGLDIDNFEGTHLEDYVRLLGDYQKAGLFAAELIRRD
ncbi:unnamed protein product, partial [marine sediment metagenome]